MLFIRSNLCFAFCAGDGDYKDVRNADDKIKAGYKIGAITITMQSSRQATVCWLTEPTTRERLFLLCLEDKDAKLQEQTFLVDETFAVSPNSDRHQSFEFTLPFQLTAGHQYKVTLKCLEDNRWLQPTSRGLFGYHTIDLASQAFRSGNFFTTYVGFSKTNIFTFLFRSLVRAVVHFDMLFTEFLFPCFLLQQS